MSEAELKEWVETLLSAWQVEDSEVGAERAVACFSKTVVYQETPFAKALHGSNQVKQYWLEMLNSQKDVSYSYEIVSWQARKNKQNNQDAKLVLNWRVNYCDIASGEAISLNGISIGLFDAIGLCYDWREWWHKLHIEQARARG